MHDIQDNQPPKSAWQAAIDHGIDMSLTEELLKLTPEQRLIRHDEALQTVMALRQAGIDYYGFDPGDTLIPGQSQGPSIER